MISPAGPLGPLTNEILVPLTNSSHTKSMTVTTIKVPTDLRDVLKEQASLHGRTLGDHLKALADAQAREDRWAELRRAMAENPIDDEYIEAASNWQSDAWS